MLLARQLVQQRVKLQEAVAGSRAEAQRCSSSTRRGETTTGQQKMFVLVFVWVCHVPQCVCVCLYLRAVADEPADVLLIGGDVEPAEVRIAGGGCIEASGHGRS